MRIHLRRLAVILVLLAVLAALAAFLLVRASLPRLEGELALPGLSAPVDLRRDALGVASIDAADAHDAMRALGHVHAQERFFEMDLMRRMAAGELSELFGRRALETDQRQRRDRLRARVAGRLSELSAEDRELLRAYAGGVNAGLGALRVRPWPYLLLRQRPRAWMAEDTLIVVYAMYYDLQDAARQERLRAQVHPLLPPALAALLSHDGSTWDAPLQGMARGDAPLPGSGEIDLRRRVPARGTPQRREPADEVGSNNFAVAGALTKDGRAIVADDMHLGLRAPNIWFRARLRYADARAPGGRVDVSGFSLPGVPGIVVGSNTHVAWGFTNAYGDWVDWIRLPGCTRARCAGRRIVEERIAVAGGATSAWRVHESPWGPIEYYLDDGSALARRWVAHLPGSATMGLSDLARAATVDDALAVADRAGLPAQNMVVGDRGGRIAWRLVGALPQRAPGCRPGTISDAGTCPPWSIDAAGAPEIVDPPSHRLWTANARVVDGPDLQRIGDGGYVTGVRATMIRDALLAKPRFDERALLAIQLDDRSLFLRRWWALLGDAAARSADGSALRSLSSVAPALEARAAPDARAYRVARAWRQAVIDRVLAGLYAPATRRLGDKAELPEPAQAEGITWPIVSTRPLHLLDPRHASWDALFEDAAREVRDELAAIGPLRERTWGERNTARICHPLAGAVPFARRLLCMPADPLAGDTLTPRAQGAAFGASQRMVVAPGHERDGIVHMPGGQSGHPMSPFWGAGHADWVEGRATPFLPGPTTHRLRLAPASAAVPR